MTAHNYRDKSKDPVQFGGVMIATNGLPVSWISESGRDRQGLGRWVWQTLSHPNQGSTTIISAYILVKFYNEGGNTVCKQHERINNTSILDPIDLLLKELQEFIKNQQEKEDNIILGIDTNLDISGRKIKEWLRKINLKMQFSTNIKATVELPR